MKKLITGIKKVMSNIIKNQNVGNESISKDDYKENYLDEFVNKINSLYNNFSLRIHKENWDNLIQETSIKLDNETISNELLKFFVDNSNLPYEVWCALDEKFSWSSKSEELTSSFPKPFIQYALANINNEYKLRYDLFNDNISGSYDEFINLYYEAFFALKNKNLYAANKSISEAKKIFSEHLDLITLEANYYAEVNKVEEAIERLSYVISVDDKYSNAYFDRANILLRTGKLQKAHEDYHKCLSLNPNNIGAQYELAGCALNMGYYEEARNLYKKLLSMYPNHKEMTSNLNSVNSFLIDELEAKMAGDKCADSEKYTLAQSYYYFNEYEKCFGIIKNIENSIEPSAELYLLCGDCLNNLNEGEKAEKYYDKAIELEPNNYDIYYSKGQLFYDLEKYDEAMKCFDKVIKLEPGFVKVYLIKAMCLKSLNKYEEAIDECNKYIDMDNNDEHALYLKGQCLMKLGKYEDAIKYFDKAVEVGEPNQEMCYMKATSLYLLENYKDAMQYYEWCLEYKDDGSKSYNEIYVQASYNMGLAILKLENTEDAYEYFNRAIEENNDFIPAYGGKLLLLSKSKNYDKCIEICAESLKIGRDNIKDYSNEDIIKQFKKKFENYFSSLDIKNSYEEILRALEEIVINS